MSQPESLGSHRARTPLAGCFVLLFLVAFLPQAVRAAAAALHYELDVTLDPDTRMLRVSGTIAIAAGHSVALRLDDRFRLQRWQVEGGRAASAAQARDGFWHWQLDAPAPAGLRAHFQYSGLISPLDTGLDHRAVLGITQPLAGRDGVFLPAGSGWYPEPHDERMTHRVRIDTPPGIRAVVPGALEHEASAAGRMQAHFASQAPLPGIDLLAGPYRIAERLVALPSGRAVRLRTYFHAEIEALAPRYLDAAAAHLERYDRALGPYAFASYSVVSSPLPVGFGMPGIAYIGKEVLRLPFIPATSLRHEVLHDWWGNGVAADPAHGNWAEGLTTLLADHALREEQGDDLALRLGWLRDYAAVPPAQDKPLSAFRARRHGADQAVGYNKSAFVFFMLRDWIGRESFDAALSRLWHKYQLRAADWKALQRAFEQESGRDLDFFFVQWVQRAGAPQLHVVAARNESTADGARVRLVVRQQEPPYRLRVPLRIHHERGHTDAVVEIGATELPLVLALPARAKAIEIDPEVRLFRRLHREEITPTLREVFIHPGTRVAVAAKDPQARSKAIELARSALESEARAVEGAATPSGPVLIVGLHGDVARLLAQWGIEPRTVPGAEEGRALAYATRLPSGEPMAVVSAADSAELTRLTRALPHLGARSYAVFSGGRSIERGLWPVAPRLYPVDR